MQFVEKCKVIDFKIITVYVFDMLTVKNGMITLDEDVLCLFHREKLECGDGRILNAGKCRFDSPKCNRK